MRALVLMAAVSAGCGGVPMVTEGEEPGRTRLKIGAPSGVLFADATVENGLTRDACSYPIAIGDQTYAPSPGTLDAVKAFVKGETKKLPIALSYRLTGYTAIVECGFKTFARHPELEVLSISAPCASNETLATTCDQCGPAGGCAKEKTGCAPTCSATAPCATGVCSQGVCSAVAGCI